MPAARASPGPTSFFVCDHSLTELVTELVTACPRGLPVTRRHFSKGPICRSKCLGGDRRSEPWSAHKRTFLSLAGGVGVGSRCAENPAWVTWTSWGQGSRVSGRETQCRDSCWGRLEGGRASRCPGMLPGGSRTLRRKTSPTHWSAEISGPHQAPTARARPLRVRKAKSGGKTGHQAC